MLSAVPPEEPSTRTDSPGDDRIAASLRGFGPLGVVAGLVVVLFSSLLGPLRAAFPLLWAWRSRTPLRELGLVRPRHWPLTLMVGFITGVALKLVMKSVVMPILGGPGQNPAFHFLEGNRTALPGMLFAVVLGAGFGEELVFRGFLFERLRRLFGDAVRTRVLVVIGTSMFFGIGHLPEQGLAGAEQATITGLVLGTIYAKTRQLWFPAAVHAAFDVAAVLIIYSGVESRVAHWFFP